MVVPLLQKLDSVVWEDFFDFYSVDFVLGPELYGFSIAERCKGLLIKIEAAVKCV